MKFRMTLFLSFALSSIAFSQYVIDPGFVALPEKQVNSSPVSLNIPSTKEDVKYIGMGKTGTANGKKINAMMYNPALLSRSRFSLDALNINLSIPPATYDAANFLNNHLREFKDALSLREVWNGIEDFNNASEIDGKLDAVKEIQDGLKFPRDLFQKIIGDGTDPATHSVKTIPSFALQFGNFGFSVYGIGMTTFQVVESPVLDALLNVSIPEKLDNQQEVADAVLALQGILQPIADGSNYNNVLPFAYSVSYLDVVGAAGYSYDVTNNLSLGVNLKVIHRRFSAKKLSYDQYDDFINTLKNDLNRSVTGFTFDLGGLYSLPSGTEIGIAVQNIIPVKKISSSMSGEVTETFLDNKRDSNGVLILNAKGDTVMQSVSQSYNFNIPFDLKLPMIINLGVIHPVTDNMDLTFDWADISKQDFRFEDYWSRFRFGTEYRLDVMSDLLGIAFRAGMADKRFTGGIGINLFRALQVDGAYAYDNYVHSYAYYGEIKLGW